MPSTRVTLKLSYTLRDTPFIARNLSIGLSPPLHRSLSPSPSLALSRSFREIFLPHLKSLLPGAGRAGQERATWAAAAAAAGAPCTTLLSLAASAAAVVQVKFRGKRGKGTEGGGGVEDEDGERERLRERVREKGEIGAIKMVPNPLARFLLVLLRIQSTALNCMVTAH